MNREGSQQVVVQHARSRSNKHISDELVVIDETSENTTECYECLVEFVQNGLLIIEGSALAPYFVICNHIQNKINDTKSIY